MKGKLIALIALCIFVGNNSFAQIIGCPASGEISNNDVTVQNTDNCVLSGNETQGQLFQNYTFTINGTQTINGDVIVRNNIVVNGTLTINGDLDPRTGSVITINPGGVLNVNGSVFSILGTLIIDGQMNVTGDFDNVGVITGSGVLDVAGNFTDFTAGLGLGPGFDTCGGGTCGPGVLPVELISFTAEVENVDAVLTWVTIDEVNNEGFYVEKSYDGGDFQQIGFVEGNGTTSIRQDYEFVDYNFSQIAYYRLKQVDFDGGYEYSPIVILQEEALGDEIEFSLFPNPVVNSVNLSGEFDDVYNYSIYSINGDEVASAKGISGISLKYELEDDILSLSKGQYLIGIDGRESREQRLRIIRN